MVEKVIISASNVVDFASYLEGRTSARKAVAISARPCRYCGAALSDGESEEECSSTFNVKANAAYTCWPPLM